MTYAQLPVTRWTVAGDAQGNPTARRCPHIYVAEFSAVDHLHSANACEDCLREGTTWVHLRACLACGHVGCCDMSPRRHARRHWESSGHPLMRSVEPGEEWGWCFPDDLFLLPVRVPGNLPTRPA